MNHVSSGKEVTAGYFCIARFAAVYRPTFHSQLCTCSTMNSTVHPAASQQRAIRSVHDDVDLELGDIANMDSDAQRHGSSPVVRRSACH
jgi:hypothetical protein